MKNNVCVFLFDGFSDWEIAYLGPEIKQSKTADIRYFTGDGSPITSAGGLHIKPANAISEVDPEDFSILVLPGGDAWENQEMEVPEDLVRNFIEAGKMVAAICGATIFLGQTGYLDSIKHTSNALPYLKQFAPAYRGDKHYLSDRFAVNGGNIITANGTAPVEFAREIFLAIGLHSKADTDKWFNLFENGIWTE